MKKGLLISIIIMCFSIITIAQDSLSINNNKIYIENEFFVAYTDSSYSDDYLFELIDKRNYKDGNWVVFFEDSISVYCVFRLLDGHLSHRCLMFNSQKTEFTHTAYILGNYYGYKLQYNSVEKPDTGFYVHSINYYKNNKLSGWQYVLNAEKNIEKRWFVDKRGVITEPYIHSTAYNAEELSNSFSIMNIPVDLYVYDNIITIYKLHEEYDYIIY